MAGLGCSVHQRLSANTFDETTTHKRTRGPSLSQATPDALYASWNPVYTVTPPTSLMRAVVQRRNAQPYRHKKCEFERFSHVERIQTSVLRSLAGFTLCTIEYINETQQFGLDSQQLCGTNRYLIATAKQRHVASVFMIAQPHEVQSTTSACTLFTVYTNV